MRSARCNKKHLPPLSLPIVLLRFPLLLFYVVHCHLLVVYLLLAHGPRACEPFVFESV